MAVIDWTLTGLIPTSGLLAWHLYDPDTSTSGNIDDASGNSRHLLQAATPPVLTLNAHNGRAGWYFDGTSNPLQTASNASVIAKQVFIFASYADAAFTTNNRGLLSGKNSGNWLVSEATGTQFFSFGSDYDYRKSDTIYADASMEAPMSGVPELMEVTHPTAVTTDGIQVGQQTADFTRRWKGFFHEQMMWDRELDASERLAVMLYFNIKFGAWSQGMPLFFPAKPLLTNNSNVIAYSRFDDMEPDFDKITDTWEYEDARKDRNEIASTTSSRWEVGFTVVGNPGDMASAFAAREIFEAFDRAARRANPFYFIDKWGEVHSDVYITDYKSTHDAHKSWTHNIRFELEASIDSVVVGEFPQIIPDFSGEAITIEGDEITFNP